MAARYPVILYITVLFRSRALLRTKSIGWVPAARAILENSVVFDNGGRCLRDTWTQIATSLQGDGPSIKATGTRIIEFDGYYHE